jgi:hypothetical protein
MAVMPLAPELFNPAPRAPWKTHLKNTAFAEQSKRWLALAAPVLMKIKSKYAAFAFAEWVKFPPDVTLEVNVAFPPSPGAFA